MKKEEERMGDAFNPEDYVYFMPEADGPCRFGMYNKYQRIVLDSFPRLNRLKIGSLTTEDSYSLEGFSIIRCVLCSAHFEEKGCTHVR